MKLSVSWNSFLAGVGAASFAAIKLSCIDVAAEGSGNEPHPFLVFAIALLIFLWPVYRDLIQILLWKPKAPEPQRRAPQRLPERARIIDSSLRVR
jgi:hypothetical protein